MAYGHFDAIFHQPDICEGPDDGDVIMTTTYSAVAARTGDTWSAEVRDLPDGLAVRVEGRTWRGVERELVERVPQVLGAAEGTVNVVLRTADQDVTDALRALSGARQDRAAAEQTERDAARTAARLLAGRGWTAEDIGTAVRLPTARVREIVAGTAGVGGGR
jgi:hypothetical protein